jgi:hypothetical protein
MEQAMIDRYGRKERCSTDLDRDHFFLSQGIPDPGGVQKATERTILFEKI